MAMILVPIVFIVLDRSPPWQTAWFDLLHRTFEREPEASRDAVKIVALQKAPGGVKLQGNWPRDRIAELLEVVGDGGALAIGLDVLLDGLGIFEMIETGPGLTGPRTERLATAIAERKVVLPVVLFDDIGLARVPTLRKRGVGLSRGLRDEASLAALDEAVARLPNAPSLTTSLMAHPALRKVSESQGLIVDDLRTVATLRTLPMIQLLSSGLTPVSRYDSMAIRMVQIAKNLTNPVLRTGWRSDVHLDLSDRFHVPMDRAGQTILYMRDKNRDLYLDGDDVLAGRIDPEAFRDKYVIVTTGFGDFAGRIDTPIFQNAMTGELIAQAIEQILDQRFLYRPTWLMFAEVTVFGVLALMFGTIFGRGSSVQMLPLGLTITFSCLPISVLLFTTSGFLVDGLGMSLGLLIAGGFSMASYLLERDRRHQEMQFALLTERAQRSRLDGELDVARRIQMSLLPPEHTAMTAGLEIACNIEPAQTVGGDFYDYAERPDGQIFFSIGDVSGKGVPASLFMALSKSLWKSAALVHSDLETVQQQANRDITRDNRDQMFVTGVACLFDPETMVLRYSGAGHDMPILARPGDEPFALPEASGPPLGLGEGLSFPTGEIQLQSGDLICLFTDGLTEAEIGTHVPGIGPALFGVRGIVEAMRLAASVHAGAQSAVSTVLDHLDQRSRSPDGADDRTLVIARVHRTDASVDTTDPA
ncbi:MAG: SpoIIE family protein phosphatase [Pseudomonadota bacterium]